MVAESCKVAWFSAYCTGLLCKYEVLNSPKIYFSILLLKRIGFDRFCKSNSTQVSPFSKHILSQIIMVRIWDVHTYFKYLFMRQRNWICSINLYPSLFWMILDKVSRYIYLAKWYSSTYLLSNWQKRNQMETVKKHKIIYSFKIFAVHLANFRLF